MTLIPKTWVAGELVTAAMLNTELRDMINSLQGLKAVIGMAQPGYFTTVSTSWTDITSGSVTLTLASTSTVILFASGTMRVTVAGHETHFRGMIDGVGDSKDVFCSGYTSDDLGYKPFGYMWLATGVTAGSRICKVQLKSTDAANTAEFMGGTVIAVAIPQ